MRRCKQCRKSIEHKHPNAVFCSNKGPGNCKDAYHNARNPYRHHPDIGYDRYDPDDDVHPFSDEAFG